MPKLLNLNMSPGILLALLLLINQSFVLAEQASNIPLQNKNTDILSIMPEISKSKKEEASKELPPKEASVKEAKTTQGGELPEVKVIGKAKVKVLSTKPLLECRLNTNSVIEDYLANEERNILGEEPFTKYSWEPGFSKPMGSNHLINPSLTHIAKEPLATFSLKAQWGVIKYWDLIIIDKKGRSFKKFSGIKNVPPAIFWDGRSDSGEMLEVGSYYSYVLEYVDIIGEKHSLMGESFSLDALRYQEGDNLIVSLSHQSLFEVKENEIFLKKSGLFLLKEAANIIKEYARSPFMVKIYSKDEDLTKKKEELVIQELSALLILQRDALKTELVISPHPKQHLEIAISKNMKRE